MIKTACGNRKTISASGMAAGVDVRKTHGAYSGNTTHLIHPDNWAPFAPSGITRNEIAIWQYGRACHPIEDDTGKMVTFNLDLVRNEQVIIDKMF